MENQNQNNDNLEAIRQFYENTPVVMDYETKERAGIRDKFQLFGFASILYAIVFTFCIYRNMQGITASLMVIATEAYTYYLLKKLEYTIPRKYMLHGIIIALLGINLMYSADGFLHFIDYIAIIMVYVSGVISIMRDTTGWDFGDSVKSVFSHVFGSLANTFDFFADWGHFAKDKSKSLGVISYILIGIGITIPLLIVVLGLLGGADAVFGDMLSNLFVDFEFADVFGIGFVFIGALLGSYAWLAGFTNRKEKVEIKNKRTKEPVIMIVIGISLGLVYTIFCGIQIMYLFLGAGELPKHYTYARYAREGFFQLLLVCLINLAIVLVGVKYFRESNVLKAVLTVITFCTYVMVASSAYRMFMYVEIYQMSVLRAWVLWTLVWLTFILTGALISIYKKSFSLFMFSMIVTSVLYIAFAYARPAYVVAEYNLSDEFSKEDIDFSYIAYDLGQDASDVIREYYNKESDHKIRNMLAHYFADAYDRDHYNVTMRNFNISEYRYYNNSVN